MAFFLAEHILKVLVFLEYVLPHPLLWTLNCGRCDAQLRPLDTFFVAVSKEILDFVGTRVVGAKVFLE